MNRQGKLSSTWKGILYIGGGLVILMILGIVAQPNWLKVDIPKLDTTSNTPSSTVNVAGSCNIQPSLAFSYVDKYNGTQIAPGTTKLYVNGQLSTCTTSPCNVDMGSSYVLNIDDGQHYFGSRSGTTTICGTNTAQVEAQPNGTLTNASADKFGTVAGTTVLAANDEQIVQVIFTSAPKKTFSNPIAPNNPIIGVNVNTSEITGVSLIGATSTTCPTIAVANNERYCFIAPFKSLTNGGDSGWLKFALSSGAANPAAATMATGHVYPQEGYISVGATGAPGSLQFGVEDDSGSHTATGASVAFTIPYS